MNTDYLALRRILAVSLFGFCSAVILTAQPANPASGNADARWQELETRQPPPTARITRPDSDSQSAAAQRERRRADLTAHFIATANEAGAFREQNPTHARVADAQMLEARNLLKAALLGDKPSEARALPLAAKVRSDRSLPTDARFQTAVLEEMLLRRGVAYKDRGEWLAHREAGARRLIAEFPDVPAAYGHLLQVAQVSPGPGSVALAQQLIDSSAPESVKEVAYDMVQRQTLSGRTLADVIGGQPGAGPLLKATHERPVVFYTWAPEDGSGVERIKELSASLPAGVLVLGINVSRDVPTAVAVAEREKLPGEQLYGARAHDSPVVRRLALTVSGLVYAAGSDGVLMNLSEQRDAAAALAKLN